MKLLRAAGLWQLRLPRSLWITYDTRPEPERPRLIVWLGQRRLLPRKVKAAEEDPDVQ